MRTALMGAGRPPTQASPARVGTCTATDCRRTDTVTLDGVHGRRCPEHPPTFDPTYAVELARSSGLPAALGYLRTDFPGAPS